MPHFAFLFVEVDCLAPDTHLTLIPYRLKPFRSNWSRRKRHSMSQTVSSFSIILAAVTWLKYCWHGVKLYPINQPLLCCFVHWQGLKKIEQWEPKYFPRIVNTIQPPFLRRRDQKHQKYSSCLHEWVVLADGIYMKHWISNFNIYWWNSFKY